MFFEISKKMDSTWESGVHLSLLLGWNNEQFAVYYGAEYDAATQLINCVGGGTANITSSGPRTVLMWNAEYNTYGNGSNINLTYKYDQDGTWKKYYNINDHLGNVRTVLLKEGTAGEIVKQFDYAPFGKVLCSSSNCLNRTKFIGKEKDKESNYADHGVRKYDDEIGRFTSIDPLWEKYYSLTPYQYAGNNPVSFLDGNGMLIYATGETAVAGVKEMNEELSFTVTRNEETGQLSVPEGVEGKSDMEKKLIEAINDTKVILDLSFTSENTMYDVNGWEQQVMGGMYGGSKKNEDGTVQAKQGVNIEHFQIAESTGGDKVGKNIIHEALEGYIGGKEKPGGNYSNSYSFSHNRAMSIFPLSRTGFNVSTVKEIGGIFGTTVKFYINNTYAYRIQFPFLQKLYENRNK